MMSSVN